METLMSRALSRPLAMLLAAGIATAALGIGTSTASAEPSGPYGVWLDHTRQGAVEIKPCGAALCGHIVWVKDPANHKLCGRQIIGNAQPVRLDTWDKGWVFNPEDDSKYDVELKTIGIDKLQVLGYIGTKMFGETMIWQRAQADLPRCDAAEVQAKATPPGGATPSSPDAKTALSEPKTTTTQPKVTTPDATTVARPPVVVSANTDAPTSGSKAHDDDDGAFPEIAITQVQTQHGRECRVRVDGFKIAFPCPD